jgi:hypothetical protein
MFNSTVLEVAIGLVFCYASVALIASSAFEALASILDMRSKTLLSGIEHLLNAESDSNNKLLMSIYNNAVAHPTGNGTATTIKEIVNKPAYMPPKDFALALIHSIQKAPDKLASLSDDINAIDDPQLRTLLQSLHAKASGNVENFQREIAAWFDAGMGRVSGLYKKKSQAWCFVIAFIIAAALNIDSIHLFQTLWQHPSSVAQLNLLSADPALAGKMTGQQLNDFTSSLNALPIGWDNEFKPSTVVGWFITASATLFGAPFWFDILKTLVRLRGTGTKPEAESHKQQQDAAIR